MRKVLLLTTLVVAVLAADPFVPDSFEMVPVAVLPWTALHFMPCGDADHDGQGEVYLHTDPERTIVIEHAGDNTFDTIEIPCLAHIKCLVADIDRDGRTELVTIEDPEIRLYESPDRFSLPETLVWLDTLMPGGPPDFVVADLDCDSALELACVDGPEHTLRIYESTGDNSLVQTATLPCVPDSPPDALAVTHDLDLDGKPELVSGLASQWLSFYEAVADDSFELVAQDSLPTRNYKARGLEAMPDADRDGKPELVSLFISESQHAILSVYEASADNEFEVVWSRDEYGGSMQILGVAVGDLDGDSVPEFFVDFGTFSRLYRCVGNDSFVSIWQSGDYEWPAAIYDINSDGLGELICKSGRDETTILQYVPLGVAEQPPTGIEPAGFPTVMRASDLARVEGRVLDVQGRDVTDERRALSPGIYFLLQGDTPHTRKVLVVR